MTWNSKCCAPEEPGRTLRAGELPNSEYSLYFLWLKKCAYVNRHDKSKLMQIHPSSITLHYNTLMNMNRHFKAGTLWTAKRNYPLQLRPGKYLPKLCKKMCFISDDSCPALLQSLCLLVINLRGPSNISYHASSLRWDRTTPRRPSATTPTHLEEVSSIRNPCCGDYWPRWPQITKYSP
jgi:hypothetical protein